LLEVLRSRRGNALSFRGVVRWRSRRHGWIEEKAQDTIIETETAIDEGSEKLVTEFVRVEEREKEREKVRENCILLLLIESHSTRVYIDKRIS